MSTILYTEQIQHGHGGAKQMLNELLDRVDTLLAIEYVNRHDDIDFTGHITVNGNPVLTNQYFSQEDIVRYTDSIPTFRDHAALGLPSGGAIKRPTCGTPGQIRYNTDGNIFEGYNGSHWAEFRTQVTEDNPEYSESFTINAGSFWEYDTWCLFGNNTDAKRRMVQVLARDPITTRQTHSLWINALEFCTIAVIHDRFIRVYNTHNNSLHFHVNIR